VPEADARQFAALFPAVQRHRERAVPRLQRGEDGSWQPGYSRGGLFLYHVSFMRSAKRYPRTIEGGDWTMGFRVARTLRAPPP
jgi:hypothetical protein